jgi:hypothetical protein
MRDSPIELFVDVDVRASAPATAEACGSAVTASMAAPPMSMSRRDAKLGAFDPSLFMVFFLSSHITVTAWNSQLVAYLKRGVFFVQSPIPLMKATAD